MEGNRTGMTTAGMTTIESRGVAKCDRPAARVERGARYSDGCHITGTRSQPLLVFAM